MKRMHVFLLVFSLFMIGNLSSCKHIEGFLKQNIQKPTVTYKRLRLQNVSFSGMTMDFEFELRNPNAIQLSFASLGYQLDFNGHTFIKGSAPKGITLAPNGTSRFRVPFSLEYVKFIKSLMGFFQGKDTAPYRLQITFGFKTPIGVINVPLDRRGEVPLPRLPKIRIVGAKLGAISFLGASLMLSIAIKNKGKFPIKMKGFNYVFNVSSIPLVSGQSQITALAVGKEQILKVPVQIKFLKVGMAIANIIRSKKMPYDFVGKINMGLFKLPFNLKGNLNL